MKHFILTLALFPSFFIVSCYKPDQTLTPASGDSDNEMVSTSVLTSTATSSSCGEPIVYDLVAGQSIIAGNITVSNDDNLIYVTYIAESGWTLSETHLYVGSTDGVPRNNSGTPVPGQFPYSGTHDNTTNYTYEIPINPNMECYSIFAHASINGSSSETSWSNNNDNFVDGDKNSGWTDGSSFGETFGSNRWGGYSTYCLQDCNEVEPPTCFHEETAWSYGESFSNLTGTNRWGWYSVYKINETNEYVIYAGQTIECGVMLVHNDENTLHVSIQMIDHNLFNLLHLYVGNEVEMLEYTNNSGTPIPGHFPYHLTPDSPGYIDIAIPLHEINFSNNEIIIAAHLEALIAC